MDSKIKDFKIRRRNRILNRQNLDYDPDQPRAPKGEPEGGQFVSENKTETLSREDKQRDKDYREAIKKGDTETAQRLIDEAAKKSGYNLSVFHGTPAQFTKFNMGSEGIHLGTKEQAEDINESKGHRLEYHPFSYIKDKIADMPEEARWNICQRAFRANKDPGNYIDGSPDEDCYPSDETVDINDPNDVIRYVYEMFGDKKKADQTPFPVREKVDTHTMNLYAKINDPFVINDDLGVWSPLNIAEHILNNVDADYEEMEDDYWMSDIELSDEDRETLEDIANMYMGIDDSWTALRKILNNAGYDGIQYKNTVEGETEEDDNYSYIALSPNDVKSADPIVKDENGDVVMPSERFSISAPDTRGTVEITSEKPVESKKNKRQDDENFEEQHPRTSEKGHEGEFTKKGNNETNLTQDEKKRDKEYRIALKRGDTETAKKLVEEAAKKAGYSLRAFHGTPAQFTSFRQGEEGIHLGTKEQAIDAAKRLVNAVKKRPWSEAKKNLQDMDSEQRLELARTAYDMLGKYRGIQQRLKSPNSIDEEDPEDVEYYVDRVLSRFAEEEGMDVDDVEVPMRVVPKGNIRVMNLYAKINNPIVFGRDEGFWSPNAIARILLSIKNGKYVSEESGDVTDSSKINLSKKDKMVLKSIVDAPNSSDDTWKKLKGVLNRNGFDGIKYLNEIEGDKNSYSYIALSPNDVKSADTIVRDEEGDIIPLSERFSTSSNDIRGHGNISNSKTDRRAYRTK